MHNTHPSADQRQRETAEQIVTAFSHAPVAPVRCTFTSELQCRAAHTGTWFGVEELRFFGSRNRHFHRPGMMVETQLNAPPEIRYVATIWTEDDGWGTVPTSLGEFPALRGARRFVELADRSWSLAVEAIQLRLAGSPCPPADLVDGALLMGGLTDHEIALARAAVGLGQPGVPPGQLIEAMRAVSRGNQVGA